MDNNIGNGELKDSLVVCESAQGLGVRGRLVKLTRFAVVFEIFSPVSDLRLSEVLKNFRIIFHEHTIYSGRATVSHLMSLGQATVCSATLADNAWSALQLTELGAIPNLLQTRFDEFLAGWQKSYKVKPEYKNIVADLSNFLSDFRLWVEQVESGLPEKISPQVEREVAEAIALSAFPSIDTLFEKYELEASRIESGLEGVHQLYVRRQLQPRSKKSGRGV